MKKITCFILAASALFLSSCDKGIEFRLDDVSPKLVVEASIENGQAPVVNLSRSMGYFSQINLNTLANSFVHNAEIYISNGTLTHKLKEYTIPVAGGYNFYYYSNDLSSPSTSFVGQLNKQYSLRIISDGKEYTATTSIPTLPAG
jgi:hypothetical protein